MTRATAELRCLHMLDCSIGDLRSNQDVQESCGTEKPGDAPQCRLAIEGLPVQPTANLALTQVDTDWNQQQSGEKNCRKNEKNNNADVGIVRMAANMVR